jgi:hypothetical protein
MQQTSNNPLARNGVEHTFKRALAAFLIAPSVGPAGIVLGYLLPTLHNVTRPGELLMLPALYLIVTPFVYFFSLLLGLPFYLTLRIMGMLKPGALIAGWAAIGVVSMLLLSGGNIPGRMQDIWMLAPFALGGGAVGYLFWRVLTWRDRV